MVTTEEFMKKHFFVIFSLIFLFGSIDVSLSAETEQKIPDSYYSGFVYSLYTSIDKKLEEEERRLEKIIKKGGFVKVPGYKKIELGAKGKRVELLKQRLKQSGDYKSYKIDDVFDEKLRQAVISFQLRHGLNPDGVAGTYTIRMMNISAKKRLGQIQYNRKKFAKFDVEALGDRYIIVNIPDYRLNIVEKKKSVKTMKVIVGTYKNQTPTFNKEMSYVVVNPKWNVPRSIAVKEILPKLKKNPDYLKRQNMNLYSLADGKTKKIDSSTVDWSTYNKRNFNFLFSQKPGARNALGRIKFIFPNKYSVYMHDTNSHYLFKRDRRAFSHGCIRLEKPYDMAEYVFRDVEDWDVSRLKKQLKAGRQKTVTLPEKIPVFITYFTSWVDKEDRVHFREDIYRRER